MDINTLSAVAYATALTLSATGSVLGTGIAGMSAIGATKKCFLEGKKVPFVLIAFVGAPLTQTIYGYLLMNTIVTATQHHIKSNSPSWIFMFLFTGGLLGGAVIGLAAYMQGKVAAAAADAHAETGKGFGNFMMILGVIESVALFVMIFIVVTLNKLAA